MGITHVYQDAVEEGHVVDDGLVLEGDLAALRELALPDSGHPALVEVPQIQPGSMKICTISIKLIYVRCTIKN